MGLAHKAEKLFSKGVVTVGRASRQQSIKAEISALETRRDEMFTQLGKTLYKQQQCRAFDSREASLIVKTIDNLRDQLRALNADLSALSASATDGENKPCPKCGSPLSRAQAFCICCGEKNPEANSGQAAKLCTRCGKEIMPNQKFCKGCGMQAT